MSGADDLTQALLDAVGFHQAGNLPQAEQQYRRILEHNPDQPDALNLLGVLVQTKGDLDGALALFDRAIAAAPDLPTVPYNKANALRDAGRTDEAIATYKAALDIEPAYADARLNLGALLHDSGNAPAAAAQFKALISAAPNTAKAHYNLGKCRQTQGRLDDARDALNTAIAIDPNDPDAHFELANVLSELNAFDDAITHIKKALNLKPKWPEAYINLGNALCDLDRQQEALEMFDRALMLDPENADALVNKAFALLALGRLQDGWSCYAHRHRADSPYAKLTMGDIPMWQGEPLTNKHVLVRAEQGLGDQILYASMIKDFARSTAQTTLLCSRKLLPVFKTAFSTDDNVEISADDITKDLTVLCDVQVTFTDVGLMCRPTLSSFPSPEPYLVPDQDLVHALKEKYRALFGRDTRLVGISWMSANPMIGDRKSIPLETLQSALSMESIQLINLQVGPIGDQADQWKQNQQPNLFTDPDINHDDDLMASLAQMAALDLVVTASSTTAHLAGASGRPAWILLPSGRARLWYWFMHGKASPWYKNVTLFRKPVEHSWTPVLANVKHSLEKVFEGH